MTIDGVLSAARADVRSALERALSGHELSVEEALPLASVRGDDLAALAATANVLREAQAGAIVTYVVNRNVNFTNACTKACRFCAFARGQRSEEAYFLDDAEIFRRVVEARDLGATEVCIQAGLAPGMAPDLYERLVRGARRVAPEIHLHAFSPEEIKYASRLGDRSFRDTLIALRDAGLGSIPGTSAEILDDGLRARLAPGRISTAEWIDVVTTAHELGIPTTSTMMYGHLESAEHRVRHLALLRSIQQRTGGFTEFVPLSFVAEEAPLVRKGLFEGRTRGPDADEIVAVHALARVMLGETFRNIQASWVKDGLPLATRLLDAGVNDLGGTLMNESISTAAGAGHGQLMTPKTLRAAIRSVGRVAAQRDTRYRLLRTFDGDADELAEPLDAIIDPEARFGSFRTMIHDDAIRLRVVRAGAGRS